MKREFIRYLAGAAAGVLLAGSPAIAADLTPVPPPAPVFTWTGFELGLHVGGGSDRTSVNLYDVFNFSDSYNSTGAFGGAHVGFNYQLMGGFVIGVQGEYNFAGFVGNSSAFPLNYMATSVREFGSADGRIGYAFNNNSLLVYAIGGFAYGDIRNTINFQPNLTAPSVVGFPVNRFFDANRYGFNVGGGLEYNFYGNWTARLEYRYYDFGTRGFADAGFGVPGGVTIAIPNHNDRETMQTGRVGMTYKFAWPSTPVVAKY
ncbi:MAG: outer membrane beta-barrel protein [Methylocella sp.]